MSIFGHGKGHHLALDDGPGDNLLRGILQIESSTAQWLELLRKGQGEGVSSTCPIGDAPGEFEGEAFPLNRVRLPDGHSGDGLVDNSRMRPQRRRGQHQEECQYSGKHPGKERNFLH